MFLNPQLIEDAQESANQNVTSSQRQQPKGRSNVNKFQAKSKEEPKSENKPVTLSRIQQKEQEMLKKQQEQQVKQDDELAESLVQFDSDPDQEDTKKLVDPPIIQQPVQQSYYAQENIKQTQHIHKEVQQSRLQNNSQYKKKLGQNESSYQQDFDIEIDKFAIIGNNHNQYYEPGQKLDDDYSLPSLQKQNNKIQFDQSRAQEFKTLNQQKNKEEDEIQIIEQQNKQKIEENEQQIIQENSRSSDEDVITEQLLQQQQKEEEVRKELKQQNDKVQMGEHEDEEGMQQLQSSEQNNKHEEEQIQQIEQKQQQNQEQPKQTCPYPKPLIQIDMPNGKKHFLLNPPPKGGMIQCTIKRDRSGLNRIYPKYHMHISNGFLYLMSAKKRACNNTSNYIISLAREDMQKDCNFIGKVRSNFMGTEFVLYDHGKNPEKTKDPNDCRSQLGIVQYESNILGSKGPRKMVVLLPKVDDRDQMYIFKPTNTKDGILKDYQSGVREHIETYVNRPPQWNSKHKAFVLNFYQRVDKPSVKNFQLIIDGKEDNILLQFGRVGEDLFNIDFQYPITPLQAFQIALTSFDYKIACE